MTPINYEELRAQLRRSPRRWLVTGIAGFIGSNLLEDLLSLGQEVVGLDNFATGHRHNLDDVRRQAGEEAWARFRFIEGDISRIDDCRAACEKIDYVLHHAALGSVPRSLEDPIATNEANITGFLTMLEAARAAGVTRFVYAASSSTYGDSPGLPKREDVIGKPLSPYGLTKYVNELYADIYSRCYGFETIGLRYFNVFGRRQDPAGAYAAVIPCWIGALLAGKQPTIHGDGETSRDFCYIDNTIQANILAAAATAPEALNQVYNVAYGGRTSLNELFSLIREFLGEHRAEIAKLEAIHGPFRPGDVRHSQADISKAERLLAYAPRFDVRTGLKETVEWFLRG